MGHEEVHARSPLKDIAYGSAAGIVSKAFEHPLDLVKVRLQSQPLDRELRYKGPWDCFVQTVKGEGLKGLYRGVSMPIMGAMAENATLFVAFSQSQALLARFLPLAPPDPNDTVFGTTVKALPHLATAGALAGAAASFVLTPVELIKCKMQVQNIVAADLAAASVSAGTAALPVTKPPGAVSIGASILRKDGLRGLWLGQTGTFIRETGGSAAWFSAFEVCVSAFVARRRLRGETHAEKADLNALELMASGAAAGVSYNCILFPADCIKSTIQTEDELRGEGKNIQRRSFLQVGKDIYRARGIRGLYSGCGLTAIRAAPGSAIIFYIYSRLEATFG